MTVVIPFFNDVSNFSEEVTLDDATYRIEFVYNERRVRWAMSIFDLDQNAIVTGISLVLGYSLLDQFPGHGLPPGEMYIIDTTEEEVTVNRDNMGKILNLVYRPEAEVGTV